MIVQVGLAAYLTLKALNEMMKSQPKAAVEEVEAEDDSGSLINDVGDLEKQEDLVESASENRRGSFIEIDIAKSSEAENIAPVVEIFSFRYRYYHERYVGGWVAVMPTIKEGIEEDVTEEEEDPVEWLGGYDHAEESCEGLSGFDWAEECDSDSE